MRRCVLLLLVAGASVVCGAAVEEVSQAEPLAEVSEQTAVIQNSPELSRIIKKGRAITRGRSVFADWGRSVMNYIGWGSEEYDDEDEYGDSDYYYPTSVVGNNPGSSYSFYNPYGNYHPARDDNFEEEDAYSWGDFMFDAAIVAVPMALVLAAMPTGLFTIPIVGRSLHNNLERTLQPFELPVLRAIEKADFLSFTTRDCQERIFCEVAQIGRHKEASVLQKAIYLAANLTPDYYAKSYSVDKLFKAARDGQCQMYKCVALMSSVDKSSKPTDSKTDEVQQNDAD